MTRTRNRESDRPAVVAMLSVAILFLSLLPVEARQRTLSGLRALIIAHRGGALEATENTMFAFRRALRVGADGIETDLRLTRDGVAVLYHDERFGRVEGLAEPQRTRLVADMRFRELAAQTLVPVGEDTGRNSVATLSDLLLGLDSGILNIEMKRDTREKLLLDRTIEALRGYRGLDRVVLQPPDLKAATKLRKALGARLKLHIDPRLNDSEPFRKTLEPVVKFKPHSIAVSHKRVSRELVEHAHDAGIEVWVYTVDSVETAAAMRAMGVDAIKTDRPALLVRSLNQNRTSPN